MPEGAITIPSGMKKWRMRVVVLVEAMEAVEVAIFRGGLNFASARVDR